NPAAGRLGRTQPNSQTYRVDTGHGARNPRGETPMSYDLYMRPRVGMVDRARFVSHFLSRPHYESVDDQSWYRTADTGVYFVFEYSDTVTSNAPDLEEPASGYPLSFNINYCRPSFFGKEAEPELHAFIERFDLLVDDPQIGGMGVGEYDSAKFLRG